MSESFWIVISAFILAFFDCYIVGIVPPVSPTIAVAIGFSEYTWLLTLVCGVFIGIGTTCALGFFRTIGTKFLKIDRFKALHLWCMRISVVVNNIGYYVIIPFAATSLSMAVSVTFLLSEKVDYKKFLLYITLGRTMVLFMFVANINYFSTKNIYPFITISIVYIIVFGAIIVVFFKHRHVFAIIKEEEKKLNELYGKKIKKENKFLKKIMFWKREK